MKNHDNCYVEMSRKDNNIFKYYHEEKSMKLQYVSFTDTEFYLKRQIRVTIFQKRYQKLNQTNIMHAIIHYLRIVRLIATE